MGTLQLWKSVGSDNSNHDQNFGHYISCLSGVSRCGCRCLLCPACPCTGTCSTELLPQLARSLHPFLFINLLRLQRKEVCRAWLWTCSPLCSPSSGARSCCIFRWSQLCCSPGTPWVCWILPECHKGQAICRSWICSSFLPCPSCSSCCPSCIRIWNQSSSSLWVLLPAF